MDQVEGELISPSRTKAGAVRKFEIAPRCVAKVNKSAASAGIIQAASRNPYGANGESTMQTAANRKTLISRSVPPLGSS